MALHPFGAGFFHDSDDDDVYTEIGQIVSIAPPMFKKGQAQTTVLKSTQAFRTYIGSFKDGDTMKMVCRYSSAQYAELLDIYGEADIDQGIWWKIEFSLDVGEAVAASLEFFGFIIDLGQPEFSAENDEVINIETSIKLSGVPFFTEAT